MRYTGTLGYILYSSCCGALVVAHCNALVMFFVRMLVLVFAIECVCQITWQCWVWLLL